MDETASRDETLVTRAGGGSSPGIGAQAGPAPEEVISASSAVPAAVGGPAAAAARESPEGGGLRAALAGIEAAMEAGFAALLREFRDKLALDRFKEEQVTRLHGELQTFKGDQVDKAARQILEGFIRLHDDLGKTVAALLQKPPEALTPELLFRQLDGFRDDIELVLGQHGVEPFTVLGDVFDPRRQTALRTVPAVDPASSGRVAERLRPGFEQGATLLRKERVAVYVASTSTNGQLEGGQS